MKSISLTQVTVYVIAMAMGSFLINTEKAFAHNTDINSTNQAEILTANTDSAEVVLNTEKFNFTSLDINKDGKLSEKEVLNGKNEWLVKSFKKIDINADALLTEQELVDFLSKAALAS